MYLEIPAVTESESKFCAKDELERKQW